MAVCFDIDIQQADTGDDRHNLEDMQTDLDKDYRREASHRRWTALHSVVCLWQVVSDLVEHDPVEQAATGYSL